MTNSKNILTTTRFITALTAGFIIVGANSAFAHGGGGGGGHGGNDRGGQSSQFNFGGSESRHHSDNDRRDDRRSDRNYDKTHEAKGGFKNTIHPIINKNPAPTQTASAPDVRDHRNQPPAAKPAPVTTTPVASGGDAIVRDHRGTTDGTATTTTIVKADGPAPCIGSTCGISSKIDSIGSVAKGFAKGAVSDVGSVGGSIVHGIASFF
jgi:hypothetical protein